MSKNSSENFNFKLKKTSKKTISLGQFQMDDFPIFDRKTVLRHADDLAFIYPSSIFCKNDSSDVCLPVGVWLSGSTAVWQAGYSGEGCVVGVIDSGISPDHPDLQNVNQRISFVGDSHYTNLHMHGTHVAGTIGANGLVKGVAPNVTLNDYRIFDGEGMYVEGALEKALVQSADDGCDIVNMSLSGQYDSESLKSAVNYAVEKGVLLVVAAGNKGDILPWNDIIVSYPAFYPSVMAVGSIDYDVRSGKVHLCNTKFSNRNPEVDLCADGYRILSCIPGKQYGVLSGTSMSCPHVAGVAAIIHEKANKLNRPGKKIELYPLVKNASVPINVSNVTGKEDDGVDNITGAGLCTFYPTIPKRCHKEKNGYELIGLNLIANWDEEPQEHNAPVC